MAPSAREISTNHHTPSYEEIQTTFTRGKIGFNDKNRAKNLAKTKSFARLTFEARSLTDKPADGRQAHQSDAHQRGG
jgi:hypothetical protein